MGASSFKGPLIVYGGRAPIGSGGSENPDLAPSVIFGGVCHADPRVGYNNTRAGILGIDAYGALIKAVPAALSAVNLATAQAPTSGTALTLTAGAGTVAVGSSGVRGSASGLTIPAGAIALDGLPGFVSFGLANPATQSTKVGIYDPTLALARNVRITSVGNDSGASFLVSGFDLYGFPQTERITGANAGVASGKKAFKFIASVVPSGALSGSNVSVGTGDVFGLPLRADYQGEVDVSWAGAYLTNPTVFTPADTTSPATSTTGDVRGTITLPTASNGTNALLVYVTPSVSNLGSLFGGTPA